MRMRVLGFLFVFATLAVCASAQSNPSQRIWVGILPVFDASGEPQAETFGQYLTAMIYRELRSTTVEPVLINPGGMYNPLSPEWIKEYAGRLGLDVVVITSMTPSLKPKSGDWTLNVQMQLMDVRSEKMSSPPSTSSYQIDRKHVVAGGINDRRDAPGEYLHGGYDPGGRMPFDPRRFEKQPLGKAARKMAASIAEQVAVLAPTVATARSAPAVPPKSNPCDASFQVNYSKTKRSSAYDVSINDREESISMVEGIAHFNASSGPVVVHLSVRDAPYRLPVQRLYLASTFLDCGRTERNLSLDIGPTGEAVLTWR